MTMGIRKRGQPLPQTEGELSTVLAEELGFDDLPAELWRHLFQNSFVSGALVPPNARGVRDSVQEAKRFLKMHPELKPRSRRRSKILTIDVADPLPRGDEMGYATYFSERVAEFARIDPAVASFRDEILKGVTLGVDDAKAMLMCPACRVLRPSEFRARQINVLRHEAAFVDVSNPALLAQGFIGAVQVQWESHTIEVPYPESFWGDTSPKAAAYGRYGETIHINVAPLSVLDAIRKVSESLTKSYPWKPIEAAMFLLTDVAPLIRPIDIRVDTHSRRDPRDPDPSSIEFNFGRITLSIASWLPVATVAKVYQEVQQQYFQPAPKLRDSEKLRLHEFIAKRQAAEPELSWVTLMAEWNRTGPKRKYRDFRQFSRDFARVEDWLKRHPYHSRDRFLSDQVLGRVKGRPKRRRAPGS